MLSFRSFQLDEGVNCSVTLHGFKSMDEEEIDEEEEGRRPNQRVLRAELRGRFDLGFLTE